MQEKEYKNNVNRDTKVMLIGLKKRQVNKIKRQR